jgi:diketogulonate reductase-like aldo/keto reductase
MQGTDTQVRDLNNGHKMPVFGLGTFSLKESDLIYKSISEYGYRMLDCASYYKNEEIVGEALNRCFSD